MEKLLVTSDGVEVTTLTEQEINQMEINRLAWEEEQALPKPPTDAERIEALEMALLVLMG